MADFEEQLTLISRLRAECRECDSAVYDARLKLQRTTQQLQRAEQKQTVVDLDRDHETARLRAQMGQLNDRLSLLREESRQLDQWFAKLSEQGGLIDDLKRNLAATESRINALRRRLAELRQEEPVPEDRIRTIEAELNRLESLARDIEASLRKAEDDQHRLQEQEEINRRRQDELKTDTENQREHLRETQARLTELLQPAFQDIGQLKDRQNEISAAADRLKADCGDCDLKLNAAISDLYLRDPHPREPLRKLDDRIPFLLLPVRLETIFVPVGEAEFASQTELWVRVYPDDIAIHTHEKVLTDREVVAGELYWTELIAAQYLREEKDRRSRAAWREIVELFAGQRAAWIARQTKPSDWETLAAGGATQTLVDLLRTSDPQFFNNLLALDLTDKTRTGLQEAIRDNDTDAFSRLAEDQEWFDRVNTVVRTRIAGFPTHDLTKTDGWTRAPRTYVMPDRFVLLLYPTETATPREITGNVIPDTLFLGPDPLDAEAGFTHKDGALVFGGAFDWMSDFDKAVAKGMGFRVKLTAQEASIGFAKILVLGVFLSANPYDSATMLEELIDNHQFGPKGFSIVPQGTPTNNTEHDGTGYSDNDAYDDLAFFTAIDAPAFDPNDSDPRKSRTDGRLLADALGISYGPMQTVQHSNQTDVIEAYSLSTALFPSTLGYWLKNWMSPVVSEQTARLTRSFFTRFVSGRGPIPAVRIGNQPYGVLVTSDFSRWTYPQHSDLFDQLGIVDNETPFLRNLQELLSTLEKIWDDIARTLSFVGKAGSDSSDVLMKILGLHPTSVEFFQRVGYSDEYLRNLINFKDRGRYANELASLMTSMPATARLYLRSLGIEKDIGTVGAMKSLHVLWQHYTTALDARNLVDNKPVSETNKLAPNYIELLAKAENSQKIINQDFGITVPATLLYLMLRNALLLQLHNSTYEWLTERVVFDDSLAQSTRPTTLAEIRPSQPSISKLELMATNVGAAEPGHAMPATTIGDWMWRASEPAEVEGAFLRQQKAALTNLIDTPTARLERCFVEHLDCCNYRLDAWQTGLFAQRLLAQRSSEGQPINRRVGIYLGAFGWVQNVTQSTKVFLSRDTLPVSLRPEDNNPILEEDDVITSGPGRAPGSRQGGFIHAPSISHAGAAALLRNAYLSHAKPEQAEIFSVNLSSERVRGAQFILEGMRNGQPIEALLGYQFERRLHDLSSESAARGDVPVLELNQFILPYRQAFPFESKEVVQAGTGGATETVPPYSVVNGLKLIQATLSATNGFGLSTVLTPPELPNATQGNAVTTEQNTLMDTLDAVKDLLTAENAFQLVRGNFDRVAAVSLAQKDATIPPELEVLNTPRGSEFTFTNRVTLHFDDLDPELPANNPWPAAAMTPRAIAETGINKWLGSILGAPEKLICAAARIDTAEDGTVTEHDPGFISLLDLGIQPIDFVWLVSISPEDTGGATELETRISSHYRRDHNVSDDEITRIQFKPAMAPHQVALAEIFPLARHLRALLLESKPLTSEDFLPAAGGKDTAVPVDKKNPKGYDVAELRNRVQSAHGALTTLADSLNGPTAPNVEVVFLKDPSTPADDEMFVGPLGDAFTKLEEAKLTFTDEKQLTVNFLMADATVLHQTLRSIANFGIADAFPEESDLTADRAKAALLARAHRVARRLRRNDPNDGVLDRATAIMNNATADKSIEQQVLLLLEAGRIVFGETLSLLPKFTCNNEIDLATADGDRDQLLKYALSVSPGLTQADLVDEWFQGLARVRRRLHRLEVVRTLADGINDVPLEFRPVQVPYRAKDCWLALEFPKTDPADPTRAFGISRDTLSIVAHGSTAFKTGSRQSGVLVDDWTEEIPTSNEITGISFRFNQPNAAPPQTLLLAVTPEETGSWDWNDLVGTLTDTLARAKRRAVEPEQLEKQGSVWNALAPALVSEFSTIAGADVSLDLMGMLDFQPLNEFYLTKAVKS